MRSNPTYYLFVKVSNIFVKNMFSARIGENDVVSHNNLTECDVSKVSTVAVKLAQC